MSDKGIIRRVREIASDWLGEGQIVRLGNYEEEVETENPGELFARQYNGDVIRVINSIFVEPLFDKRVQVRRSRLQPNRWKITEELEDYGEPISAGRLAYHHKQHEENGPDRVTLDRKQIRQLSVRVSDTWKVQVYGGTVPTAGGIVIVNNEEIDLEDHIVTAGARYVSLEIDDDGNISLNVGAVFGSPGVGTAVHIPEPDPGKYPFAYVLLFEGQTQLIDRNIKPILPLPGSTLGGSHSHEIFDDTEGNPANVSTVSSADGSSDFASRRDHVHLYTPGDTVEEAPEDGILYGRKDGSWEAVRYLKIVMSPDLIDPPVPVLTVDGDDYLVYEE